MNISIGTKLVCWLRLDCWILIVCLARCGHVFFSGVVYFMIRPFVLACFKHVLACFTFLFKRHVTKDETQLPIVGHEQAKKVIDANSATSNHLLRRAGLWHYAHSPEL